MALPYTAPGTFVDGSTAVPLSAANMNAIAGALEDVSDHVMADQARARHLYTFGSAGNTDSQRFRQALLDVAGMTNKPVVLIPPGTTLDSGANNPFILPTGFHMMCSAGAEDETGYSGKVNIRHTGSTTTLGVFQLASGSKFQKMSNIAFSGTTSTRAFVDVATDGSDGRFPQYFLFDNVSFNQFESIWQTTGTGVWWQGSSYINNMACTRPPLQWNGSDHTMFSNGTLMEMGGVATYATRAACSAMFHMGNCSNTSVGPVYWTGSPTCPVRLDGGTGGVDFSQSILEGRPVHSNTLWCAGPLVRLTGGRSSFRNREHGYAMRNPADVSGYTPGGFYHVSGGDHVIDGGTFTPYPASEYPSYTLPNGTTRSAAQTPPFAWVTGSTTRLKVTNITRGANVSAAPEVWVPTASTANVITDATVQVVTY